MDARRAAGLAKTFPGLRVLVVGDCYLDEYVRGTAAGLSPEFPVARLVETGRDYAPGAAANIAANLASLGCAVSLAGIVGHDRSGDILVERSRSLGIDTTFLAQTSDVMTGTFTRFTDARVEGAHHFLRLDRENTTPPSDEVMAHCRSSIVGALDRFDAVFLADYNEFDDTLGVLQPDLIAQILRAAPSRPKVMAMSRRHLARFSGADYLTCNRAEATAMWGPPESDVTAWMIAARARAGAACLCVTLGSAGVICCEGSNVVHVAPPPTSAIDPCGAGDSLASAFLLASLAGASLEEALELGNAAAGIVIGKAGTQTVSAGALVSAYAGVSHASRKMLAPDTLVGIVDLIRRDHVIVVANGYFDLIHAGHIHFLREARSHGDTLIVAINSDRSTAANKGPGRPVLSEDERVAVLGAFEFVDFVTVFDELTPISLLRRLRPHVLAKGGNFTPDEVVGKDIVESAGGRVVIIPYRGEVTTKTMIQSIQKASDGQRPQ